MTQDVALLWPLSALGIHTGTNLGRRSLLLRKACTQDNLFTVERKVSDFFVCIAVMQLRRGLQMEAYLNMKMVVS